MSNMLDFLNQFFGNKKPKKDALPFLHESIDLNSVSEDEVIQWISSKHYDTLSNSITKAYRDYYIKEKSQSSQPSISILDTAYSSGWLLHADRLQILDEDYKFFAFALNMKLKKLGYSTQLAELKSRATTAGIESMTHFYLKPSLKNHLVRKEERIDQLYGNISIEYKTVNGDPQSFKFLVKSYMDSTYQPPKSFDMLNELLFN